MSEVPEGWTAVPLQQLLLRIDAGQNIKCDERPPRDGELGLVKISAVTWGTFNEEASKTLPPGSTPDKRNRICQGDLLISRANTIELVGASVIVGPFDKRLYLSDKVLRLVVHEPTKRWINYALKTPQLRQAIQEASTGNQLSMRNIPQEKLRALNIPIAPEPEQQRIADQLDNLLARVQACNDRFDAIPGLLKRLRQAVLDSATLGALTADWREANGLPFRWRSVLLQDIADVQGGVTKDAKKQSSADEEVPYLRVANVQRGYIDLSEVKTIRVPAAKLKELLLDSGDVLFNEGGDLDKLGRGWVWEGQIPRCSFQNHVFRARLRDRTNQPKFVSWWGNSRGLEYFLRSGKQTTNLASINKTMLAALPISLPPANEQSEIVRRVEELFKLVDCIEARYTAVRGQAQRLTPLLLAKAFRGELVPQDPNDEPARVLLARIAAQRGETAIPTKTRQPRKPRAAHALQESTAMTKSRHDDDVMGHAYLASHLRRLGAPTTAEALFKVAELPVADFYKQLAWEVAQGHVKDGQTLLEARGAA